MWANFIGRWIIKCSINPILITTHSTPLSHCSHTRLHPAPSPPLLHLSVPSPPHLLLCSSIPSLLQPCPPPHLHTCLHLPALPLHTLACLPTSTGIQHICIYGHELVRIGWTLQASYCWVEASIAEVTAEVRSQRHAWRSHYSGEAWEAVRRALMIITPCQLWTSSPNSRHS